MALDFTRPPTEMSSRNLAGYKERPVRTADRHTAIFELIFWKMWEPRRITTLWVSTACYRDIFTLFISKSTHLTPVKCCCLVVWSKVNDFDAVSQLRRMYVE
jgi:hypothetical protein